MFNIGSSLAAARQARGLDLRAAAELTYIRVKYLSALEDDRFDDLPGRTYARAFLRTYATALDLNADEFVAEFDARLPEPEEPEPEPPARTVYVPLSALVGTAVVVLVGIVAWSVWSPGSSVSPSLSANVTPASAAPRVAHVRAARKTVVRAAPVLVIRAVNGPCWILVRRGSATGPVVAERTLEARQSARFAESQLWVRLGAPWNVVVQRGTRTVHLASTHTPVDVQL